MSEITISLEKTSSESLYLQLYSYIKQEINSGKLVSNDKLPSKRQLARDIQCSLNTIQSAYDQLVDEGYIYSKLKSGYYVANIEGFTNLPDDNRIAQERVAEANVYRFDVTQQGVDMTCFPFLLWKRVLKESVQQGDQELLRTGDPQGSMQLRSSIARYLHQSRSVQCTADQIIVSSGTEYLVQLLVQLFERDKIYAIENPGYDKLTLLLKSNRVAYKPISLDSSGMCPDELENSHATVAYITPSHQYPTGCIMPLNRRLRLLQWANKSPDRYIIEDDYDGEFRYSGKPIPAMQGVDANDKVIYLGAFSKSLSPAMRISYMILPKELMEIYRAKLNFYICPVPTVVQKALARFMEAGYFERHLNRMRNLYRHKREALIAAIQEKMPEATILGANAGLHFLLKLNSNKTVLELTESAKKNGIKVTGCQQFYSEDMPKSEHDLMMIGFASIDMNDIDDLVDIMKISWC